MMNVLVDPGMCAANLIQTEDEGACAGFPHNSLQKLSCGPFAVHCVKAVADIEEIHLPGKTPVPIDHLYREELMHARLMVFDDILERAGDENEAPAHKDIVGLVALALPLNACRNMFGFDRTPCVERASIKP